MTIRCIDARVAMRDMSEGSVDCIFTDPPYPVISGGNKTVNAPKGILTENDGKIFNHNDIDISEYAPDLFRVLRDPGHCYIMTNLKNLWCIRDEMLRAGFKLHNLLVWKKNNANPNRWYMKNCEYILFFRKGKAFSISDCGSMTVKAFDNVLGGRTHEVEKPVDLCKYYIENSTIPGAVVFDPFMGSGATCVAAKSVGRKYIGFDIDPRYVIAASQRLEVMPT